MNILRGKTIREGIALGPVLRLNSRPEIKKENASDPSAEEKRLRSAFDRAREATERESRAADRAAAGILQAQSMMLADPSFAEGAVRILREESTGAEYAVLARGNAMAAEFEAMPDAYLRARAEDMRQTAQRVCDILTGFSAVPQILRPSILTAEEFTPALLSALPRDRVLGLVALRGSPASHTAILAANYGYPYLTGIDPAKVEHCETAVLDGETGCLVTDPDGDTVKRAEEKLAFAEKLLSEAPEKTRMRICANISSEKDLEAVLRNGADGIGLFRTEFLFMNRSAAPEEEEQYRVYSSVLRAMEGREVIIRTIDIGTDKPAPYLGLPREENPALGLRGARVSLEYGELFRAQLRALLRAACHGDLGVMFPMIASVSEVEELRSRTEAVAAELEREGIPYKMPRLGIMVETPAAALIAEELGKYADFFSLGTNDLTQYTLALDRQAEGLDRYYDPYHEGILKLIGMTVKGAHRNDIPAGICGQLGADPKVLDRFIRMGLDEISVAPASIPAVRRAVARAERKNVPEEPSAAEKDRRVSLPEETLASPVRGRVIPMERIPDPAFAGGVLGPCFGVEPEDGDIRAPVTGTVTTVAETGHAIGLRSDTGAEVLVHAGIDTVRLGGRGFTPRVKPGDRVNRGEPLLTAELKVIRDAGLEPTVITVLLQ